ncbi:hypothetical protein KKA14_16820, partial [bacterium]|nr:hypothetical protein [bacterium]
PLLSLNHLTTPSAIAVYSIKINFSDVMNTHTTITNGVLLGTGLVRIDKKAGILNTTLRNLSQAWQK